ncbi:MAG: hypothetical protein Q9180_002125, partial [Flavoplaca navasiana]
MDATGALESVIEGLIDDLGAPESTDSEEPLLHRRTRAGVEGMHTNAEDNGQQDEGQDLRANVDDNGQQDDDQSPQPDESHAGKLPDTLPRQQSEVETRATTGGKRPPRRSQRTKAVAKKTGQGRAPPRLKLRQKSARKTVPAKRPRVHVTKSKTPKGKARSRGNAALREIRRWQKSTDLIIPRRSFQRLIKELMDSE